MANRAFTRITEASQLPTRVWANLKAQVSWVDSASGEKISTFGLTEHVGESSALVNIDFLPAVGSVVELRLFDDKKTIVETTTEVIRVERDPGKPLVALSVLSNFENWKQKAMDAAQDWVTRNWQINYKEEYAN